MTTEVAAPVTNAVEPHVADKIEPGAILYSSWGYDQTNVDFYMVTRTTEKTAWIVPMGQIETPSAGYSPMAGFTTPTEPQFEREFINEARDGYVTVPIKPERHKIQRYSDRESLSLTSYSGAYLWDGQALYASHYA